MGLMWSKEKIHFYGLRVARPETQEEHFAGCKFLNGNRAI